MPRELTICLISNIKSIHFIKDIDNIFQTVNNYTFHVIDVLSGKERAVHYPTGKNLIYHILSSHVKYKIRYILEFLKIKNIIKGIKPDIVHCYGAGIYGLIGVLLNIHPLIITVHGSEIYRIKNKNIIYRCMMKYIIRNAEVITYASDGMKNFLINHFNVFPEKLVKFYRGINPKVFYRYSDSCRNNLRKNLGINKGDIVFFSSRRIYPLYNIFTIVKAFYESSKIFDNIKLILTKGDIENSSIYYAKIKKAICQGVEQGNIILIEEFVEHRMMAELYNVSDIFISIPETDELSASIFEGMACGSLPIMIDIDSYKELNVKCAAFFIKNGKDIDELTEKMIHLIRSYSRMRGSIVNKNQIYVSTYLTYEVVKKNIIRTYNSIV